MRNSIIPPFCDPTKSGSNSNDEVRLASTIEKWILAFQSPLVENDAFSFFFDFDKTLLSPILALPNCIGIRIFPGIDEDGAITVSIVGTLVSQDGSIEILSSNGNNGNVPDPIVCCPSNGTSKFITQNLPSLIPVINQIKN
jgi:hypothetical protein